MRSISPGTDADYVTVVEVFDNLSHAEIHGAVRTLDPAALSAAATTFLDTAAGLGDGIELAHGEIRAAIADGWRGAAATRASEAVREFEYAGRRLADVLTAVGVRLSRAGEAAESVRAAVAEPSAAQPDSTGALLDSEQAAANATIARDAENARLDAVQAMEVIYAGAFLPTGSGVPAFSAIENATQSTNVAGSAIANAGAATGNPASGAPAGVGSTTTPAALSVAGATLPAGSSAIATAGGTSSPGTGQPSGASGPASTALPNAGTAPATAAAQSPSPNAPGVAGSTAPTAGTASPSGAAPVGGVVRPSKTTDRERRPGVSTDTAAASSPANTEPAGDAQPHRDSTVSGGEAATGMGAGAVGGMMGGALAASESARSSSAPRSTPATQEPEDEDDEFLRYLEEEPTYLEPADEVNALIGKLEPTSPAVLGEWSERE